jgi:hypothetical protein
MSDAPSESFRFDPRDLITGPFEDCPECNAPGELGLLMVTGRGYVKRCRRCRSDRSFELPALNNRVIYLDQHAISHLAKSIHPDFRDQYAPGNPRTQDGFWPDLFARLDRLSKLQLAVCPESTLQRQESLLDDRLASLLRTMYEHLPVRSPSTTTTTSSVSSSPGRSAHGWTRSPSDSSLEAT